MPADSPFDAAKGGNLRRKGRKYIRSLHTNSKQCKWGAIVYHIDSIVIELPELPVVSGRCLGGVRRLLCAFRGPGGPGSGEGAHLCDVHQKGLCLSSWYCFQSVLTLHPLS